MYTRGLQCKQYLPCGLVCTTLRLYRTPLKKDKKHNTPIMFRSPLLFFSYSILARFLLLPIFSIAFFGLHAQSITNLSIIPGQPTSTDTIYVVAETMHANSPCPMASSSLTLSGDSVMAYATHSPGMLPAICISTDTILVGQLSEGLYTLVYHLENPYGGGYLDTDVLHFMVAEPGSFAYIDSIFVFPALITEDDSVFLVSHSSFSSSPCNLTDYLLTTGAGHLASEAWHVTGILGTPCYSTDTFSLGKLAPGHHTITHTILDSATSLPFDSCTTSFQVHQSPSAPQIQSLEILPSLPDDQDSLMLKVSTRFDWSDCSLTHHQQTGTASAPDIHGYYLWGDSLTTCHSLDTIPLGVFSQGSYTLTYYLLDSISQDTMDINSITFDVQLSNHVKPNRKDNHQVVLYPNPAHTYFMADLSTIPNKPATIVIYTNTGQALKAHTLTRDMNKVDISNFKPGTYNVIITDSKGNEHIGRIIKASRKKH